MLVWTWADGLGEGNFGRIYKGENSDLARPMLYHSSAAGTLRWEQETDAVVGQWSFAAADGQWNAVGLSYDRTTLTTDPVVRVNFAPVSTTEISTPTGTASTTGAGYVVGNRAGDDRTFDGAIQHVQVFNRILTAREMDAALRRPGSIRNGLKLWLPMYHASYLADHSGSGFHGTGANLATRRGAPVLAWGVGLDRDTFAPLFPPAPPISPTPGSPSAQWRALSERVGGEPLHTLFELSVTHPTPKTWYLATVDLAPPAEGVFDPGSYDPGTFAVGWAGAVYRGLVREHTGVSAAGGIGGVSSGAQVTLTLINDIGTGGPGRKWFDAFATPVPGYSEPYDLQTATLRAWLYWEALPGEPLPVAGDWALRPDSVAIDAALGEPETVTLTFGPNERRYQMLPHVVLTPKRYAHLPPGQEGMVRPTWFGRGIRVPAVLVDADGGLFELGASPLATPIAAASKLWTVRPDPDSDAGTPVAWPARFTTAGETILSVAGNGTALTVTEVAQRIQLDGTGAFIGAIRLPLRRQSGGTPCVGEITVRLVLDRDGLPGDTLIDANASATANAAIVTTGVFADYDIFLRGNNQPRAAFLPALRAAWLVVAYAKTSGDLQIEVDSTGAYAAGMLATRSGTDSEWIVDGQQQRRGIVKHDYTGGGALAQDLETGVITLVPPVTVPGL